jgi:hypothetical protein
MMRPLPFPAIRSSRVPARLIPCWLPLAVVRTDTKALTRSFVFGGMTSLWNASLFHCMGVTWSTQQLTRND